MNFFNVKVDGNRITNSEGLDIAISEGQAKILKETGYQGKEVIFGIRPEDVSSRPIVQEVYPCVFGIYELLPAFLVSLAVCAVVSLVTPAPTEDILAEFDAAK